MKIKSLCKLKKNTNIPATINQTIYSIMYHCCNPVWKWCLKVTGNKENDEQMYKQTQTPAACTHKYAVLYLV